MYSLFVGERGRVKSGIGLARLVRGGEIQLRCALGDGPRRAPPAHTTHLDTLCLSRPVSIPLSLISCLSRLLSCLSCISCLLCDLFCFCLASVLSLSCLVCVFFSVCPSLCPSLCLSVRLSVLVSPTVRPKWLLSPTPGFLREEAPDIQI